MDALDPKLAVSPGADLPDLSSPGTAPPLPQALKDAVDPRSYRLLSPLGEGGMGAVWRAVQLGTQRTVALKFMAASFFDSESARLRFEREVALAAQLEHAWIARVYDSGVHRGVYFYALELIEGQHLDQYVADQRLNLDAVLRLMSQICQAVQHAHDRGIIHRDLKPSNIMVTSGGEPKLLDFGLAKQTQQADLPRSAGSDRAAAPLPDISRAGQRVGTPSYMAPEQADSDDIDVRVDVYSLGKVLQRVLRNCDIARRQTHRELQLIIARATAPDRRDRYASVSDLGRDLEAVLRQAPVAAHPRTRRYLASKWLRRHRRAVAAVSLAAALAVALLTAMTLRIVHERDQANAQKNAALLNLEQAKVASYRQSIAAANAEILHGRYRLARTLLDACPPELRQWEWDHLSTTLDSSLLRIPTHGRARSTALSPCGSRLAYSDADHQLFVYDAHRGRALWNARMQTRGRRAQFLNDAQQLAVLHADEAMSFWDVAGGRMQRQISLKREAPLAVAQPLPQGDQVAALYHDGLLRLLAADGSIQGQWEPLRDGNTQALRLSDAPLAVNSDGSLIAVAHARDLALLRPSDNTIMRQALTDSFIIALAFQEQQSRLCVVTAESLLFFAWESGQLERVEMLRPSDEVIVDAVFTPRGDAIWLDGINQPPSLHLLPSGKRISRYLGPPADIACSDLAELPDSHNPGYRQQQNKVVGRMLAATDDGLDLFAAPDLAVGAVICRTSGHVNSLAFDHDNQRIVMAATSSLMLFDPVAQRPVWRLLSKHQPDLDQQASMALHPGGRFLAVGHYDAGVRIRRIEDGQALAQMASGAGAGIEQVQWSPDGRWLLAVTAPQRSTLWPMDPVTAQPTGDAITLQGNHCAAFAPRDPMLALADVQQQSKRIRIWRLQDPAHGPPAHELLIDDWPTALAWSDDGRELLIGTQGGQVLCWPIDSPGPRWAARPTGSRISALATLDAQRLVVAASHVAIIDIADGHALLTLLEGRESGRHQGLALSSDRTAIAVGVGPSVHLWRRHRPR